MDCSGVNNARREARAARMEMQVKMDDRPEREELRGDGHPPRLTSTQRQVLELVAQGLTSAEIAARLHRAVRTIESHRFAISRRLGARNAVELITLARAAGLIDGGTGPAPRVGAPGVDRGEGTAEAELATSTGQKFFDRFTAAVLGWLRAEQVLLLRLGPVSLLQAVSSAGTARVRQGLSFPSAVSPCMSVPPGRARVLGPGAGSQIMQLVGLPRAEGDCCVFGISDSWHTRIGTLCMLFGGKAPPDEQIQAVVGPYAGRVAFELERLRLDESQKGIVRDLLHSHFLLMGLLNKAGVVVSCRTSLGPAGQTLGDVVGHPITECFWWSHSEEAVRKLRAMIERASAGETVARELELNVGAAELLPVAVTISPVLDESGEARQLVICVEERGSPRAGW